VLQLPGAANPASSPAVAYEGTASGVATAPVTPSDSTRGSIESEALPPLSSSPPASVRADPASVRADEPPPAEPATAPEPSSRPVPEERSPERQEAAPAPASSARAARSDKFLKPVDGRIVSGFGPKSGGLRNDGINISAARGTPVRAAQDGTVAYAGNELPGFGNLVLVKHPNGWISAYGHNEEILVSKGQAVRRGQPIAKVGSSGNVVQPQLHFELRNGSRAIDPMPHIADS
jgi:murein DD-endopeptidase MepM/ murein hydrolase activator NlpD